jgi:hypothetical protein
LGAEVFEGGGDLLVADVEGAEELEEEGVADGGFGGVEEVMGELALKKYLSLRKKRENS